MEAKEKNNLEKILGNEFKKIPTEVQVKLNKYIEDLCNEVFTTKAVGEASKNNIDEVRINCEQQITEFKIRQEEDKLKLKNLELNVLDLRNQLNTISSERTCLLERINEYEHKFDSVRVEKNNVVDERDSLLRVVDRQNIELVRLQQEFKVGQEKLKKTINAKCEALARIDEIECRESALEFKEKRMEQERSALNIQIQKLSEDLSRSLNDLQSIRRENTIKNLHFESKIVEKSEELKVMSLQCTEYKKMIDSLKIDVQDLTNKLLAQNDESSKMMEHFKKELEAKTKLAELYKSNCSDSLIESKELSFAVADLKRMLSDASEQYGELETKLKSITLKYNQEIEEKNKIINEKKNEILHANNLLKEFQNETIENALSKLAPSAATASRLIKSDLSLTEFYALYVKTSEENELQKRENNRLNLQMKTILLELETRAPILKKQEEEYERLVESRSLIAKQLDEVMGKKNNYKQDLQLSITKISHLQKEIKKLKYSQCDLSRQVCFLLKEVEQNRFAVAEERSRPLTNIFDTSEVISKKMVTFKGINELQENNQKLLLLVRDLSSKLEDSEAIKLEISATLTKKKIFAMSDCLRNQSKLLSMYMAKCERYKKLYFNSCSKSNGTDIINSNIKKDNEHFNANLSDIKNSQKLIADLESQLREARDQTKMCKDQHEYYMREKNNNEKILNEELISMRTEVRELTSTNCRLMSSVEYYKEQIKIFQKNVAAYKQQIVALEDRNKSYEGVVIKHEQTIMFLKDEIFKSQKQQSEAEVDANHLKRENSLLTESISRLQSEKEVLYRSRQNQNLLLNNLEMIKTSFEKTEVDSRLRLENRLDETTRELKAQKRRCEEEQDRFRDLTAELKHKVKIANERMEEEKSLTLAARKEIADLRNDLIVKSSQINELSKKLQESLMPTESDNPIAMANKKAKEFELKMIETLLENDSLKIELKKSREHADQYYKMSESAENEIKAIHVLHEELKNKFEKQTKNQKMVEANLKSRVEELEAEIQLQNLTEAKAVTNNPMNLKNIQEELKESLQKLSESNRELRAHRSDYNTLLEAFNNVEQKYANEMVLHSADIKQLINMKEEIIKSREQIANLRSERDILVNKIKGCDIGSTVGANTLENDKEEQHNLLIQLETQNNSLHNQIEVLTTKFKFLEPLDQKLIDVPEISGSLIEDRSKNNEQMLQIIKFLRKEKDISSAKVDILKTENVRLLSEHTILQKKIDELNMFLNDEQTKSDTVVVTVNKHDEILRKIETLNAITDSNRILREERDSLAKRLQELNNVVSKIQDKLIPLQKENNEISTKLDELTRENNSLKVDAIKWRQRANLLIEKSNKNPEEFKRLQSERENLAKMLTCEKDQLKNANEELYVTKKEKQKLEAEVLNLAKQLSVLTEEKKKVIDDCNTVKQTANRLSQEVMELKNKLLQREEVLEKLTCEIEAKEVHLQDSKNKEIQIRKIAKRYKDSFLELSNKVTNTNFENSSSPVATHDSGEMPSTVIHNSNEGTTLLTASLKSDLEKELRNTIHELNATIRAVEERNDQLCKENENLKIVVEKDEKGKIILRDAKSKIINLTESKNAVAQELASAKSKLEIYKQSSGDHDSIINDIKTQYEDTLTRMEKDLSEQNSQNKEIVCKLTRENESLLMRVNQLSRQLGMQQVSKPTTSSGVISDKTTTLETSPRTANVKPLAGSNIQQSATVTPWRGCDTPLASIRPISVQNSRTAAILPTSQNLNIVHSGNNTALVPPQQVHTTANSIEFISSSPTSTHSDYLPSTSSAIVAVATIPPMGAPSIAESSQEAESVSVPNNDQQVILNAVQTVALVSPRVEGSLSNPVTLASASQPELNNLPSTSGTSSSSHTLITNHRHASSTSNVTTTQATSGQKRPRDTESDVSIDIEMCGEKPKPLRKRTKIQMKPDVMGPAVSGSELCVDVEYQVPTSSQRDQEDDIIVVDSEEDEGLIDDGEVEEEPVEEADNEGYGDSYGQDQDMDDNDCADENENRSEGVNNEVEVVECVKESVQRFSDGQTINSDAGSSQLAKTAVNRAPIEESMQENNQQSQAISSGSGDILSKQSISWKTSPLARQHISKLVTFQNVFNEGELQPLSESSSQDVISGNESKFTTNGNLRYKDGSEAKEISITVEKENSGCEEFPFESSYTVKSAEPDANSRENKIELDAPQNIETVSSESHNNNNASQSEIIEAVRTNKGAFDEAEVTDGVSSEGEKTAIEEDLEEEGREAEASTSPSINTRSKSTRGNLTTRRPSRGCQRGGRPTPIVWQDNSGNSRSMMPNHRNMEQPESPSRTFQVQRAQRARRMRRPGGSNYGSMRYS